ncbi:MAG TPA: cbb3-type cytochrome c oxidase subunit II [Chthoniobacterales bacterium]
MKYFFPGILAAFLIGWFGQILLPYRALSRIDPFVDADTNEIYPVNVAGIANQGREVYIANGCVSCHTQQVRADYMGGDLERNWGTRRTVARDYMYENPVLLGTLRVGPDLAGVGARDLAGTGEADLTTAASQEKLARWHYIHLYNPRIVSPDSNMPAYKWLFEEREIKGQISLNALNLPPAFAPKPGYEIVPKPEAEKLVGYLLSLNKNHSLPEAKAAAPAVSPQTGGAATK